MIEDFYLEQFGRKTLKTSKGIMVYKYFEDESLYIHIAYVKPEYRGENVVGSMENELIKIYKPKTCFCFVDLTSNNPELSLKAILKRNYKVDYSDQTKIVLRKDLNGN